MAISFHNVSLTWLSIGLFADILTPARLVGIMLVVSPLDPNPSSSFADTSLSQTLGSILRSSRAVHLAFLADLLAAQTFTLPSHIINLSLFPSTRPRPTSTRSHSSIHRYLHPFRGHISLDLLRYHPTCLDDLPCRPFVAVRTARMRVRGYLHWAR